MPTNFAPINIGDLTKPASLLLEKISAMFGTLWQPRQIKRIAAAEAEAAIIRAKGEVEAGLVKASGDVERDELHARAARRFAEEETRKQINMETITEKAIPLLEEKSEPQSIDDDWMFSFFEKCRNTSDDEMQELWAKILAGEANRPGSYSKRTINSMSMFSKKDAEYVSILSGFCCSLGFIEETPFYYGREPVYEKHQFDDEKRGHLESIGVVSLVRGNVVYDMGSLSIFPIKYHDEIWMLKPKRRIGSLFRKPNRFLSGKLDLTEVGEEVISICKKPYYDEFPDFLVEEWRKSGFKVKAVEKGSEALKEWSKALES